MKKMKKLFESLNLIYYEYNNKANILFVDNDAPKDYIGRERMKITYALTKEGIDFFIDENENIVISYKDKFFVRLQQRYKNILKNIKNSDKKIYILSDKKVKNAKNLPVFDIKYLKQDIDLQNYDALIFTSQNAIKALDTMDKTWKNMPSYVIAPQTAKVLKYLGGTLTYLGKKHNGDEFANEIKEELYGKNVLYVCGTKIVSNLVSILNENDVYCDTLAIYDTICKHYNKEIVLPKESIIIFSSPSTIDCFLENVTWDDSYRAISIGKTTSQYFPKYINPIISDNTSLEACVQKALELD
jgi:uroporphyrinogen-III synthase